MCDEMKVPIRKNMRIKVAVLDQDASFRETMQDKLIKLAEKHDLEIGISKFETTLQLVEEKLPFDLLLADTVFTEPEVDGIEWVKAWKATGLFSEVIFVSNQEERIFSAIMTGLVAFVRKSNLDEDLDKAIKEFKQKVLGLPPFIVVPEGRKRYFYAPDDIIYMCSKGHYIDIHSIKGSKRVIRGKLDEMEKLLGHHGFLRIHTSYLVNIRHVDSIERKKVCLSNKKCIISSRKYQQYVYEKLKIYQYENTKVK